MSDFRPGNFQILPTIIKNLLIINVLVYLAQVTATKAVGEHYLEDIFALHTWQSTLFRPWQFVTYLFMHGDFMHLLGNMFVLWMFGSVLENLWGPKRFLVFYLISGLGAAFCHMIALYFENNAMLNAYNSLMVNSPDAMSKILAFIEKYDPGHRVNDPTYIVELRLNTATLGASGSVFGCLAAFGYLFPNRYIYLNFFLPIKAKWFVIGYAAVEFFSAVQNSAGDNVAHIAHLGGALVGLILVYYWNKTNRRNFY
ncbi:rhomboid family intramembrane serine protease [Foetidibacter luteolus]|uniref:rhomboid family intramembrane serine protease n=1 Tax=Foetidibacter luteolus TaxID=2608880 RepID=UPI00129ACB3E|nr:rhomboid family intramembrane serine protease [Foetidibacter luteolus]